MLNKIHNFYKNNQHKKELCCFSFLFLLCIVIFKIFPNTDLIFSSFFYDANNKNWLIDRESNLLWLHYRGLPYLGEFLLFLIISFVLISFFTNNKNNKNNKNNIKNKLINNIRIRKNFWLFLLCAALVGPIAITETIKTFSGRTRPINTQNFNGKLLYTPPLQQANQCKKNCSFVSGHVSAASFILAFFWFVGKKRYIYFALSFLFIISTMFARIIPGGHFLSDCIFGFFVTYFSLWLTELLFYLFNIKITNNK